MRTNIVTLNYNSTHVYITHKIACFFNAFKAVCIHQCAQNRTGKDATALYPKLYHVPAS
jgi:hypothetical protein